MKLLTIVVPCYNSEAYMEKCVDSLLVGGKNVEIIIVNDGSQDRTAVIAEEYASQYPGIVKVIHQKNAGHGGAVNTGIREASGLYFKVVDSDDWVDQEAFGRILEQLEHFQNENIKIDMLISNYVYEKEEATRHTVMHYRNIAPRNRVFTWNDFGHLRKGKYLLMHSLMYRTSVLRKCGLQLPEHTFYVDNIFAYFLLPFVTTMYYLDVDFYRYFIGRDDQSVNEKVMIGRIDQQIRVNLLMLNQVDLKTIEPPKRRQYMTNYLEIITAVSSILLIRSGSRESLWKKRRLWQSIKERDLGLYRRMRFGIIGAILHVPGKIGRRISVVLYKCAQRVYGFN